MTLRRLKWSVVVGAVGFLGILEYTRFVLRPVLNSVAGSLLLYAVVVVCIIFFSAAVFSVVEEMQGQLSRRNRELLALHEAGLNIAAELSLETVLQTVVDTARQLTEARYGALAVYDDEAGIRQFVTSGLSPEVHRQIGDLPRGHGLLGEVLKEGQRLRLRRLSAHPRSAGFPPQHPPMNSLLAVPVVCSSPYRGNLYLTEKLGAAEFSAEDEEALVRFATQSAIAIDNAYLHQQVGALAAAEERLRIAHEMHDGLAQVLAYVNTKAQAVKEFLRTGAAEQAGAQLDQLAAAAREVYTDVRESILGLRATSDPDTSLAEALRGYVEGWQDQTGVVADLAVDDIRLPPPVELQIARIVQESLTNVRKHAHAGRVEIRMQQRDGAIRLTVADDGVGFTPGMPGAPRQFPRFGLATMRERVESVGGRIEVTSAPGQGTRIVVELPPRARRGDEAVTAV
jgi:signal transduction histidine kinase